MSVSKSPDRHTFQLNAYINRCKEEGTKPDPAYIQLYCDGNKADQDWADKADHSNDMEWDLRTTDWILEKVRASESYAQNLYAAMCNNNFQKLDVWPLLAGKTWGCSWRYAGGIIADMREQGDYIDWYCSGIGEGLGNGDGDGTRGYVSESFVTDEVCADLARLGWGVTDCDDDD